jgi:hypothetical protein
MGCFENFGQNILSNWHKKHNKQGKKNACYWDPCYAKTQQ